MQKPKTPERFGIWLGPSSQSGGLVHLVLYNLGFRTMFYQSLYVWSHVTLALPKQESA